jgi:hypothetical protein
MVKLYEVQKCILKSARQFLHGLDYSLFKKYIVGKNTIFYSKFKMVLFWINQCTYVMFKTCNKYQCIFEPKYDLLQVLAFIISMI